MTKNKSFIQKTFTILALALGFSVITINSVFASTVIPAEVISTADPINVSDTSYTQQVILRFPSEKDNRTEEVLFNYPNSSIKVPLKQGDRVSVKIDSNASAKYEIVGYDRVNDLIWLPGLFIAFYVIVIGTRYFKRLILQFIFAGILLGGLYLGVMIHAIAPVVLAFCFLAGFIYSVVRFKRQTLILIASLSFGVTMVFLFIVSFFLIDVLKMQMSMVGPLLTFYGLDSNIDFSGLIISGILIASSGGILAVITHEVREGVTLKAKENGIERNRLITKAARIGVQALQEKAFTFFMFALGLLVLFVVPFLAATSFADTFNYDPIASIVSFLFFVLLGWFFSVPITAIIEGFALGRVPSHKLISEDIIDEFEGII